jgi:hypothetical protein
MWHDRNLPHMSIGSQKHPLKDMERREGGRTCNAYTKFQRFYLTLKFISPVERTACITIVALVDVKKVKLFLRLIKHHSMKRGGVEV